jgi:uncharacterized membrane protein
MCGKGPQGIYSAGFFYCYYNQYRFTLLQIILMGYIIFVLVMKIINLNIMNKLFFVLFLLVSSLVYSQGNDDFKNGIDFSGAGTEPFWSVKIDFEKGIYFNSPGDDLKIETGKPEMSPTENNSNFIYTASSEKFDLKVQIKKENCSDGMSDNTYPYSVKVSISEKCGKETKELKGCGNYTYDSLINDIWALINFKSKDISKDKTLEKRPYMEIHVKENKIIGNASCNEFYGTVEILGDKILFGDGISRTKMNCSEMLLETDFLNALSGKIFNYKIEKLKLYLIENGEVIMEFNKMD